MPAMNTTPLLGKKGTTSRWAKLRRRILERDGYACRYCGGQANSVDHIIPRSAWPEGEPGVDDPANLAACCVPCNSKKGSRVGGPTPTPNSSRQYASRAW